MLKEIMIACRKALVEMEVNGETSHMVSKDGLEWVMPYSEESAEEYYSLQFLGEGPRGDLIYHQPGEQNYLGTIEVDWDKTPLY